MAAHGSLLVQLGLKALPGHLKAVTLSIRGNFA